MAIPTTLGLRLTLDALGAEKGAVPLASHNTLRWENAAKDKLKVKTEALHMLSAQWS